MQKPTCPHCKKTKRFNDHKYFREQSEILDQPRSKRTKEIFFFGVAEGASIEIDRVPDNSETDIEKCASLCQVMQAPKSMNKIDCFRIGPIVDDKLRQIKVKFFSPTSVTTIAINSRKLRDSSD